MKQKSSIRGRPTCSTMKVQPAVVVGRDVVDVGDVEGVLVERPDRRALVDVDVLDAELDALVEERLGLLVAQLPAARAVVPLGGVELDALEVVLLVVGLELLQTRRALARVEAAVDDQLAREALEQRPVHVDVIETGSVPLLQVRRLKDGLVDAAVGEDVLLEVLDRVLLELLERPVRLSRAEALVGVEALDPALGVLLVALDPVGGRRVPEVQVAVEDEVLLAVLLVHLAPPTRRLGGRSRCTRPRPPGWRTARRDRRGQPYARNGCS